jgi:hypothetical protein
MSKLVSIDAQLPKVVKIKAYPRLAVRATAGTDGEATGYVAYGTSQVVNQVVIAKDGLGQGVQRLDWTQAQGRELD